MTPRVLGMSESTIAGWGARLRAAGRDLRSQGDQARRRLAARAGRAENEVVSITVDPTGRVLAVRHATAVLGVSGHRWSDALISGYRQALASAWSNTVGETADTELHRPAHASASTLDAAAARQREVSSELAQRRVEATSDGVTIAVDGRGRLIDAEVGTAHLAQLGQDGLDAAVLTALTEATRTARSRLGAEMRATR